MTYSQSNNSQTIFDRELTGNRRQLEQERGSDKYGDSDRPNHLSRSSSNRLNVSDLLSSSSEASTTKSNSFDSIKPADPSSKVSSPLTIEQVNDPMMSTIDKRPTTANSTNASTPTEGGNKSFTSRQRSNSSAVVSDSNNSNSKRPITPGASSGGPSDFQSGEGVTAYHYAAVQQITENRENIEYILNIREQPKHSRMCGVGEKADRRPIDPAPIIQLRVVTHENAPRMPVQHPSSSTIQSIKDSQMKDDQSRIEPLRNARSNIMNAQPSNSNQISSFASSKQQSLFRRGISVKTEWGEGWEDKTWYLENPYYFMYAMLADAETDDELHLLNDGKTRYTTGSCVSCLYHLKDIDGTEQGFFVFPDLSIRVEGRYRLKLCLFETIGHEVHHCKSIYSKPFNVYTAKRFPGMEESTTLSKSFADQGLKVRVRKNPRARRGVRVGGKRKDAMGSEDDSDGEMYVGGGGNDVNVTRRPSVMENNVRSDDFPNERGIPKRMKGMEIGPYRPNRGDGGGSDSAMYMMDDRKPPFPSSHDAHAPHPSAYGYNNEGQSSSSMRGQYNAPPRRSSEAYPPPGHSRHSGPVQLGMPTVNDSQMDPRHTPSSSHLNQGPPSQQQQPMPYQYGAGHGGYPVGGDAKMGRGESYVVQRPPPPQQWEEQHYYRRGEVDERGSYGQGGGGPGYANRHEEEAARFHSSGRIDPRSNQDMYARERYYEEQDSRLNQQRRGSTNLPSSGMHNPRPPLPPPPQQQHQQSEQYPDRVVGGPYRYDEREIRGAGVGNRNGRMIMPQHNESMDGLNRQRLPPLHVALSPETSPREPRSMVPSPSGPRYSSGSGGGYGHPSVGGSQRYPPYPQHQFNEGQQQQAPPPPPMGQCSPNEQQRPSSRHLHGASGMMGQSPPSQQQQQQQPGASGGGGGGIQGSGRIPFHSQSDYPMPPPQAQYPNRRRS